MKKLKAFYYILINSVTNTKYYKEILKTKFIFSIKYLLLLGLFASLITSSSIVIRDAPKAKKGMADFIEQIGYSYPEDLTISFKDGTWTINKEEPYIIPMPDMEGVPYKNFVVFNKQGTIEDIKNLDSLMLFNDTNVITREEGDSLRVYPIKDFPNFDFDRSKVDAGLQNASKLVSYTPYIIFFMSFFGLFSYFTFVRAIYLVFISAFLWLVALISKNKITFKDSYRISLHAMTLPVVVQVTLGVFGLVLPVDSWFGLLNVILALAVFMNMKKSGLVEEQK